MPHGQSTLENPQRQLIEMFRLLAEAADPGKCLEWTGAVNNHGYGQVRYMNECWLVHRLVYKLSRDDFSETLDMMHRCDNPKCFNIHHLKQATTRENVLDMLAKGRGAYKLKPADVLEIRRRCNRGDIQWRIARDYGVTRATVTAINTRQIWKGLE